MAARPDILMIMADQLTALALPAYGHQVVRTPHLDRLAAEGVVFEHAYCNFPLCAPSRASLMSGRLASRIEVYDNAAEFRAVGPHHGARAAGAGLPHLPRRQDALRRPRPAARLRGAADHRHLPGRFRLDAQLGRARRSGSTGGTTTWARSRRRASPRPPTSSTSTTRWPSRPSAGSPSTRARADAPPAVPVRLVHPPARPLRDPAGVLGPLPRRRDRPAARPADAEAHGRAQPPPAAAWPTWPRRDHGGGRPPRPARLLRRDLLRRRPGRPAAADAASGSAWPETPSSCSPPTMARCWASAACGTRCTSSSGRCACR